MPERLKNKLFLHKRNYLQLGLIALLLVVVVVSVKPAAQMVFRTLSLAEGGSRKLPIYSVETPEKKVAISFDAAWGADDTDNLLQILRDFDVKATFFLCGYWVDKYPEEVKRIFEAGHDIGNHSATHAHGGKLGLEQNKQEIMIAHEKIKNLLGIDMNLYRPPYGEYTNTVLTAAEESGYFTIQWDVDSHDWMKKGLDYEINRVLNNKNLRNGSIILFHNDAKDTPKALPIILQGLKDKGFSIGPISDLIYKSDYHIDHTGRQILNAEPAVGKPAVGKPAVGD